MKKQKFEVTKWLTSTIVIEASSEEEAKAKFEKMDWDNCMKFERWEVNKLKW